MWVVGPFNQARPACVWRDVVSSGEETRAWVWRQQRSDLWTCEKTVPILRCPRTHSKSQPLSGPLLPGVRRLGGAGPRLAETRPCLGTPCIPCESSPRSSSFSRAHTPTAQMSLPFPERGCRPPAPRQPTGTHQQGPPAQGAAGQLRPWAGRVSVWARDPWEVGGWPHCARWRLRGGSLQPGAQDEENHGGWLP